MAKGKGATSSATAGKKDDQSRAMRNFPVHSLEQALQLVGAIADAGAGKAMDRILLAKAVDRTPSSSEFRLLLSSSLKYGLTSGTEKADYITPEPLGMRIVKPTSDEDKRSAMREAALKPELFGRILRHFNRSKLPPAEFLVNTLVRTFQVDAQHAEEVATRIQENAAFVGILEQVGNSYYVRIDDSTSQKTAEQISESVTRSPAEPLAPAIDLESKQGLSQTGVVTTPGERVNVSDLRAKRVFVTHGKNKEFIDPIRKLLRFGELEAVVSTDRETVSQPVPDKVMSDMRSAGAAIIHVSDERVLMDKSATEHVVLNENVLIEIGAAMALYGRRFILLVKDGIRLPSNLQGLYEVRYQGESLDGTATIKLLEAINDIKNHPLPVK